jgi:hypothetical protein
MMEMNRDKCFVFAHFALANSEIIGYNGSSPSE